MFARYSKRRKEAFSRLNENLQKVKSIVVMEDPSAKIYLFGSVARGNYNMASDIDILIVSRDYVKAIRKALIEAGFGEPYEFHIRSPRDAQTYFRHVKDIRKI
ncbi:hypothetical protein IX51_09540 [uncultured archaeon]|nr:hypothetical protein IX51_09540 [uncultured archaeon]